MIYVSSLAEMPAHAAALRPARLVSLVQAEAQPPTPPGLAAARHLRLEIDDIWEPAPDQVLPEAHHVETLIGFLRARAADESVLLHCIAGVSRSTAAALVALVLDRDGEEAAMARLLRRAAPHARPNPRIVALADRLLGRDGRLIAACEAMGPAEPFLADRLITLPRAARARA